MLTSLALIFLFGLAIGAACKAIRVPAIIGMMLTGIVLGPQALNLLDPKILSISPDLWKLALVIIIIKAGLSIKVSELKQVERPLFLLGCIPALFEIAAFFFFAPYFFGISKLEALVMGSVLAAVSPAVVIPRMVMLTNRAYGTEKSIPQMIMAGAGLDNVFVIMLFSTFLGFTQAGHTELGNFIQVPISLILGMAVGVGAGLLLSCFFETAYAVKHYVRNSLKVMVVLGVAFILIALEGWTKEIVSVSGLFAVMSMACTLNFKASFSVTKRLSEKFSKLWLAAEVILFVTVGAAIDISYILNAGLAALWIVCIGLVLRSLGVVLSLLGTNLNFDERLFCVLSYLPKATVQAAIGSVPLAMGLPCGHLVLSVAVVGIFFTSFIGTIAIDGSYQKLLQKN